MPGKTPAARGRKRHETTLAPDRLEPQTTEVETAAHPGLLVKKKGMH